MQATSTVTNWIQERFSQKGIELSLPKSKVLFPEGLCMSSLTNDEQQQLTKIGLSVAEGGMPVVGIPVGTEEFQRNFVSKIARGDPAELILRLATLDDPQASYQLLRLSGVPRLFHLLRTIAPSITNSAAKIHDNMMMWTMRKIVLGKMANSMRISTVKEERADPTKSEEVDSFNATARAQVHLPMREGGLGITSNVLIRESAFVAGQALVFSKSVQASTGYTVEQCLPRLAQLPTGLALIDSLKKLEEIITKDKLEKAVGQSWAKLATSDELTPALKGVYLLEAGKAGKPREDGNPDVEHQPPSTFSRNEFGQHYQVFGAQALHFETLHAAVRHMVETDLQKVVGEETPKKRALIRLEEAKGKGVLSWLTTQGLSADERMLPDLYRESIGRVLGSHDRADCNTGKLCGAGALLPCKDRLSRAHSLVCTKTGASTFLHNRMVRVVLKTLRECHMPIAVEDSSPFTTGTGRGKGLYKMDLVIPPGLHAGEEEGELCTKSILIDVLIVNPSAGRSIDKSILKPGSALEDRAASKANHYAGTFNPSRSTLLTAAFSTNGGLGKGTNRLIVAIANHMAHEAFCRGNFEGERALVRLKAFHTKRIRRRFTFELARFLSMRTRDVFKRHGLLIDQLPPGPIGWDLCDNDSSEGNYLGVTKTKEREREERRTKTTMEQENMEEWKRAKVVQRYGPIGDAEYGDSRAAFVALEKKYKVAGPYRMKQLHAQLASVAVTTSDEYFDPSRAIQELRHISTELGSLGDIVVDSRLSNALHDALPDSHYSKLKTALLCESQRSAEGRKMRKADAAMVAVAKLPVETVEDGAETMEAEEAKEQASHVTQESTTQARFTWIEGPSSQLEDFAIVIGDDTQVQAEPDDYMRVQNARVAALLETRAAVGAEGAWCGAARERAAGVVQVQDVPAAVLRDERTAGDVPVRRRLWQRLTFRRRRRLMGQSNLCRVDYTNVFQVEQVNPPAVGDKTVYIDSAASSHMICTESRMSKHVRDPVDCAVRIIGSCGTSNATKKNGTIKFGILNVKNTVVPVAVEVLLVRNLGANILSVGALAEKGVMCDLLSTPPALRHGNHVFPISTAVRRMYVVNVIIDDVNLDAAEEYHTTVDADMWHRRRGHCHPRALQQLADKATTGVNFNRNIEPAMTPTTIYPPNTVDTNKEEEEEEDEEHEQEQEQEEVTPTPSGPQLEDSNRSGRVSNPPERMNLHTTEEAYERTEHALLTGSVLGNIRTGRPDPCLYSLQDGEVLLLVYVDGILFTGTNEDLVTTIISQLKERSETVDLGDAKFLLRMAIRRHLNAGTLLLTQEAYTKAVLAKFNMADAHPTKTPAEVGPIPTAEDEVLSPEDTKNFRSATVWNMAKPGPKVMAKLKRLLWYLKGTTSIGITYSEDAENGDKLTAYAHSDFGGDLDDRKSTTVIVLFLSGGPVDWRAAKQPLVAVQSVEAESRTQDGVGKVEKIESAMQKADMFTKSSGAVKFIKNRMMLLGE
ncbi:unnamed protein product [Ectocarpus sp. CCAP 1310/34]|nr:unnamed protein product [Ectocarpus sp. CCAP 1310/34]